MERYKSRTDVGDRKGTRAGQMLVIGKAQEQDGCWLVVGKIKIGQRIIGK